MTNSDLQIKGLSIKCEKCCKEWFVNASNPVPVIFLCQDCVDRYKEFDDNEDLKCVKTDVVKYEECSSFIISTAFTHDTMKFETCIISKHYNDSNGVIVEEYNSKKACLKGHIKWKRILRDEPKHLSCVSTSPHCDTNGYIYPREEN